MTQYPNRKTTRPQAGAAGLEARAITRLRVLNCIRESKEISRTGIAAALKLSPATVTFVTSALMSGGLVEEITSPSSGDNGKRGRPRVALRLRSGEFHVAGIKVSQDAVSVLVLDLNGQEVAQNSRSLTTPKMTGAGLVSVIWDAVCETCAALDGGPNSLAGICIGLAGQVDAPRRFVHWSSSLTERNVDLGALLDAALPCAAFVENDANLVAKAEQLFGAAQGVRDFLVVTVEYGVGMGIVLGDQLHRGERGCGAEFGHTKVALNGAQCQCGQRGCLEAYVGTHGLLHRARKRLSANQVPNLRTLVDLAQGGNPDARQVLAQAGQFFAVGLSNLINLFDPEKIILTGAEHRIAHLHTEQMLDLVRDNVIDVDAPLPQIEVRHSDDLMWARGAAAMGIEEVTTLKVRELGK